jgi:hypothetical protein
MNRHYDRYLTMKYAPLYRNRYSDMRTTAMCWGFYCGDGWFNIINTLSRELCYPWMQAVRNYNTIKDHEGVLFYKAAWGGNDEESDSNFLITPERINQRLEEVQIAEKMTPVAVQVKEKFGGLRFYVDGASEKHQNMIDFAEHLSETTCEVCGKKGKRNNEGWISTRCNEHRHTNEK